MAVGIYGGSFDPIHLGHLITTQIVFEKRSLEKIIFIPSYISPLKQDSNALSYEHRCKMVELAIKSDPNFEMNDYEVKKGEVSYTIDTLIYLKNIYEELELIIGLDNLVVFEKWKNPDEIFNLAKIVVMVRHQDNLEIKRNRFFEQAIFVNTPNIEIASSDIRKRIRENLPIDFLVPGPVVDYIVKNNLYR